ncbi:hypothetical protein AB0D04_21885 [Streptomyces sp. NPDC048483]|uniref:hypothetical protein n=1 Tax=Streptomyces sp. NPDC048483 TaxID=3154927 RepID=UPI003444E4A9
MLQWACTFVTVRRAGVWGTGSYGAALSRCLPAQHLQVIDVNRPDRTARRRQGKSDPVDAQAAARAVLSGRTQTRPSPATGRCRAPGCSNVPRTPPSRPAPSS